MAFVDRSAVYRLGGCWRRREDRVAIGISHRNPDRADIDPEVEGSYGAEHSLAQRGAEFACWFGCAVSAAAGRGEDQ